MGVINFANRRGRAEARFLEEHGDEMDALRDRIETAPSLIDRIEAAGAAVGRTERALGEQDWDTAVEVIRGHDASAEDALDPITRAHRDTIVALLEEELDLAQVTEALARLRQQAEAEVAALFDTGERDLARLADLEQQHAVAAGEAARGNSPAPSPVPSPAFNPAPSAASDVAPGVVPAPPLPSGVRWGRKADRRADAIWTLVHPLLGVGERVECVVLVSNKKPPRDVLVVTDQRFLVFDSASVALHGPEISRLRTDVTAVAVAGFSERITVTTVAGEEIDCGSLGHSADRDLAQQYLLPVVRMSWER